MDVVGKTVNRVQHRRNFGLLSLGLGVVVAALLCCHGCGSGGERKSSDDPCSGVTCSGHGRCVVTDGAPLCSCDDGYHEDGLECLVDGTDPCAGVACSGHGECKVVSGAPECDCEAGYHSDGLTCQENAGDPEAFYVAETGSDANDGSLEHPWATVDYGLEAMPAGATLYIRGGSYSWSGARTVKSGLSDEDRTVISAYPGEDVYITSGHFDITGRQFWTINGLKHHHETFYPSYGINVTNSSNFTISNNDYWRTDYPGIRLSSTVAYDPDFGCREFSIVGNNLRENQRDSEDESMSIMYSSYGDISYNDVSFSSDPTNELLVDIKTYSEHINFHHNTLHAEDSITGGNHTCLYLDGITHHIADINVYANHIYGCNQGIRCSPESYRSIVKNQRINIYNNLIHDTGAYGIVIGWVAPSLGGLNINQDIFIFNNTIVNGANYGIYVYLGRFWNDSEPENEAYNINIYNNILAGNNMSGSYSQIYVAEDPTDAVTIDNNVIIGYAQTPGTNAIRDPVHFVDPESGDWRLDEGSSAIDACTDAFTPVYTPIDDDRDFDDNPRPGNVRAWDIGAFERTGG